MQPTGEAAEILPPAQTVTRQEFLVRYAGIIATADVQMHRDSSEPGGLRVEQVDVDEAESEPRVGALIRKMDEPYATRMVRGLNRHDQVRERLQRLPLVGRALTFMLYEGIFADKATHLPEAILFQPLEGELQHFRRDDAV